MHQQALAHRRARLAHHHVIQPVAMQPEAPASEPDGARRHQHDLPAVLLQAGDGAGDRLEMLGVKLTVASRHDAGAQLDHRAARCTQPLLLFAFQWMVPYVNYFIIFAAPL